MNELCYIRFQPMLYNHRKDLIALVVLIDDARVCVCMYSFFCILVSFYFMSLATLHLIIIIYDYHLIKFVFLILGTVHIHTIHFVV